MEIEQSFVCAGSGCLLMPSCVLKYVVCFLLLLHPHAFTSPAPFYCRERRERLASISFDLDLGGLAQPCSASGPGLLCVRLRPLLRNNWGPGVTCPPVPPTSYGLEVLGHEEHSHSSVRQVTARRRIGQMTLFIKCALRAQSPMCFGLSFFIL